MVPFFRTGERARDTLKDIARQTFRDFEAIFVDDCSGDGTSCIIRDFFESNSGISGRLLVNRANLGVSVSRNRGLAESVGEYVVFCDSDDRMSPFLLEKLYRTVKETGSDMAWCGFGVQNPETARGRNYLPDVPGIQDKGRILKQYLKGRRLVNAWNVIYRRAFLKKWGIRYPVGCRFAEDREFVVKTMFHAGKVAALPDVLYTYIQHPGQSTVKMRKDPSKYAHAVGVYQRLLKYFEDGYADDALARECCKIIRSFELPNALVKMICSFAEMGDYERFYRSLQSRAIRGKLRPCAGSLRYKPEVFAKALFLRLAPGAVYRKYQKRQRE